MGANNLTTKKVVLHPVKEFLEKLPFLGKKNNVLNLLFLQGLQELTNEIPERATHFLKHTLCGYSLVKTLSQSGGLAQHFRLPAFVHLLLLRVDEIKRLHAQIIRSFYIGVQIISDHEKLVWGAVQLCANFAV